MVGEGKGEAVPLVSIGVPVLNGANYLEEALDSLLTQELADLEIIISDNASVDGTRAIAERYVREDPRVRYVRHDRQRGASFNFSYVARAATGRYFKWAAHDDLCGPRFLSDCVAELERDPGVVLAYPRAAEIDANGRVTREFPAFGYGFDAGPSQRVGGFLAERPHCLETYGVMRRDVAMATRLIGPFTSSDVVFLLEMLLQGRFARVDQVQFYCRRHDSRSLERFRANRRQWYSGAARGRGFPEWRLVTEMARSVRRAPLGGAERLRSLGSVAAWAGRRSPLLARNVAAAAKAAVLERVSAGSAAPPNVLQRDQQ